MGIRGRLLVLVIGATLPLAFVWLWTWHADWQSNRQQIAEALEQQAELAAVIFARWLEAQAQPLVTAAGIAGTSSINTPELQERLRFTIAPRPYWQDVRVLAANGATLTTEPANAAPLPPGLGERLLEQALSRSPVAETDWTRGEGRYMLAVAVPLASGGAVVARIDGAALNEIFHELKLPERAVITILDGRRRIIYRSLSPEDFLGADVSGSTLMEALGDERSAVIEVASPTDGTERVYGLARAGATDYIVTVGMPSATLYVPARQELARQAFFSLLALLCAVGAALVIARGIARPIRRLRRAAQAFGEGDFAARAPAGGSGELAELGATFNAMAARIEDREARLAELDRLKSEFVSSVSHELRTPLTTIKTLTRLMLRGSPGEAERREYLETMAAECDRQIDLVMNLLDLSRIEAGAFHLTPAPADVGEAVRSCLRIERQSAALRGHELRAELADNLPPARADQQALRRVLRGLVENAIKYTPDGGRITLAARAERDEIILSVADTGRGIRAEDLPRIFEKFYRGQADGAAKGDGATASLTDEPLDAPGIGLGLYLARALVEQLGGRITAQSVVGQGSIFTVRLPVWRDRQVAEAVMETETEAAETKERHDQATVGG